MFYARWQKISWPGLGDNLVVVAPVGLFFGRIANFINGELWGRIITSPNPPAWAMRFPKELEGGGADAAPGQEAARELVARAYAHDPLALNALEKLLPLRHPSQLYEAGLEGLLLFAILWVIRTRMRAPVGMLTGVFFIAYAAFRIFGEQFREPDFGIPLTWGLSRGQFLSLFMFIFGGGFVAYSLLTRRYQLPGMREKVEGRRWKDECRRRGEGARVVPVRFAAVLLAGGQSRRMGRDKALLLVDGGRVLWERQLDVLRSLGPAELFISGPARPGFPYDVRLLEDERPGLGPLSGIVAALEAMTTPLLVVLAVDLPAMRADFLRGLLAGCSVNPG